MVQENLSLVLQRLALAANHQAASVNDKPSATEILQGPRGGRPQAKYYESSTYRVSTRPKYQEGDTQ